MKIEKFDIDGLMLIEPKIFKDSRGFFTERFREDQFKDNGICVDFIQDNFSRSTAGILRGLHYQYDKPQSKLITCMRGKILDVAVDIRKESKTFGKSVQVILNGDTPQWLWVPAGFAHGFCVISEDGADVLYKVDTPYNPASEGGIIWNDSELKINWNIMNPLVSERDQKLMNFDQYKKEPRF